MVDLKIQDLILDKVSPCVYLTGKGSKTRVVPLLPKTVEHLRSYLDKFHPEHSRDSTDYLFYTYGGPQKRMSEDTVAAFVKSMAFPQSGYVPPSQTEFILICFGIPGRCIYTRMVFP